MSFTEMQRPGKVSTRPMFQPKFLNAPAVVCVIDPVQGGEVGAKKGAAP